MRDKGYELKVIGAGLPRTGTLSTKIALEKLGYGKCYHMIENIINDDSELWIGILENKNKNFNTIFKNYSSTVDAPANVIWKELLQENPAAKVILTVRDPESWAESFRATIMTQMYENNQPFGFKFLTFFWVFA